MAKAQNSTQKPSEADKAKDTPGDKPEGEQGVGAQSASTTPTSAEEQAQARQEEERKQKEQDAAATPPKESEEGRTSEDNDPQGEGDPDFDNEQDSKDYADLRDHVNSLSDEDREQFKNLAESLPDEHDKNYDASQDPSVPSSVVAEDVMRELSGLGESPTLNHCRKHYLLQGGNSRKG